MEEEEDTVHYNGSRVSSRGFREISDRARQPGADALRERTPREKELDERILTLLSMAPRPLRRGEIAKALGVGTHIVRSRIESLTHRSGQIAEDDDHGVLLSKE